MIVTVSDESNYLFEVTKYMVLSLSKKMPHEKLFLVVVNGKGEYDFLIKEWHPNINILHYDFSIENKEGFYFCFMALPLFDLLSKYDEPLLYIDGDVIIKKDLTQLFNELNNYDLLVKYRPFIDFQGPIGSKYGARTNSGVLALSNTKEVRNFALDFKKRIIEYTEKGDELISWNENKSSLTGVDQELLWIMIMEYKDKLNFFPLDDKYNDSDFKAGSFIWHAKGTARKKPEYLMQCSMLSHDFIGFALQTFRLVKKNLFNFIKTFLKEPDEVFEIKELKYIFEVEDIKQIVVLDSTFYVDNYSVLKNKDVICYDLNPVIFYKNKNYLISHDVAHFFIIKDYEKIESVSETDLLIYSKEYSEIVSKVKSKNMVVKQ